MKRAWKPHKFIWVN